MIVSHKYRFIFLKTTKTAGTSIAIALSQFCGPRDIVAPLSAENEQLRESLGYRTAQLYGVPRWENAWHKLRAFIGGMPRERIRRLATRLGKKGGYFNHMTAEEVQFLLRPNRWNKYFSFCVVRNPWDRVVSYYYWRQKDPENRVTFEEFVRSDEILKLRKLGWELYTINGEIAVDFICRYEQLERDLELVRKRIGLPCALSLPKAKGNYRPDRKPYRELFNAETREIVSRLFQDEIRLFDYRF